MSRRNFAKLLLVIHLIGIPLGVVALLTEGTMQQVLLWIVSGFFVVSVWGRIELREWSSIPTIQPETVKEG